MTARPSPTDAERAARVLPETNWSLPVWTNRRKALAEEFRRVREEEREAIDEIVRLRCVAHVTQLHDPVMPADRQIEASTRALECDSIRAAIRARGTA